MGYFHANLKKKEGSKKKVYFQAAEFAIPWAHTVSKYIECESLVATESKVLKTPLPCKKQDRTKKRERTPTSNKQNKKRRVNGGFKTRNTKKTKQTITMPLYNAASRARNTALIKNQNQ